MAGSMSIKHRLLLLLKPFQIFIQRLGYRESDFTPEIIDQLLVMIKPGDILGSYESGRLTAWFIKGNFDHVAIVDENLYVVEAVGDDFRTVNGTKVNYGGVRRVKLEQWLWKKNHIFVARHPDKDIAYLSSKETYRYVGKGYDYSFALNGETFYCAEVPYLCFKRHDDYFMSWIEPEDEILPIDYLGSYLDQVYNSRVNLVPGVTV